MATIYARLKNHCNFEYHILFLTSFYKINEEDQRGYEIELFFSLNINHNLTETDINYIDFKSRLEQ